MPIRHGAMHFRCDHEAYRGMLSKQALRHGVRLPRVDIDTTEEKDAVAAVVNGGRWVVACPCGNVEFAWLSPKIMMCSECWNQYIGGKWRRVEFPKRREEIELVLSERPFPKNRNWTPKETVDDLVAENREQGIPVGVV